MGVCENRKIFLGKYFVNHSQWISEYALWTPGVSRGQHKFRNSPETSQPSSPGWHLRGWCRSNGGEDCWHLGVSQAVAPDCASVIVLFTNLNLKRKKMPVAMKVIFGDPAKK